MRKKLAETAAEQTQMVISEIADDAVTPTEEKKPAKAPRKTAAKKAAAPKETKAEKAPVAPKKKSASITSKVVIELSDKSASSEALLERAKEDWVNKGNELTDVKELALYVNASEGMVYYVVNDDYLSGSFVF